ncbi:GNAT family N-acetyltransferase [Geomicrobium sediminis]|uniref:GNAT superfamily N-acetyltransferase n=1 Tax=Geomicrobium sediminis TaxID=1347788 RepID=A0ABS2PCH2_9BACL|nr:GNAT family N-acetyltransferase [Geomicrobium sediminis]MBM7633002.1 GNAT superfamily N-acetyltransferase [Geomicrobium sediminis]
MIRSYCTSDVPYVIEAHRKIYKEEYDYDESFVMFITQSITSLHKRNYHRENVWIVDEQGQQRGSIAIQEASGKIAKLGLFLVEPVARGKGYAEQLLQTAIRFCINQGYEQIELITNANLLAARKLYRKNGFTLIASWSEVKSGKVLEEEQWRLELSPIALGHSLPLQQPL